MSNTADNNASLFDIAQTIFDVTYVIVFCLFLRLVLKIYKSLIEGHDVTPGETYIQRQATSSETPPPPYQSVFNNHGFNGEEQEEEGAQTAEATNQESTLNGGPRSQMMTRSTPILMSV